MPIVLKGGRARPALPIANPGAEMPLEDLGRAICPVCKRDIEWQSEAAEIGKELGGVHAGCGLVFVAVNSTWRITVMDKYKNELCIRPDGRLGYKHQVPERAPAGRRLQEGAQGFAKTPGGSGFLMTNGDPMAPAPSAPVRAGREADPDDEPADDFDGDIAEPDFGGMEEPE